MKSRMKKEALLNSFLDYRCGLGAEESKENSKPAGEDNES